LVRTSWLAGVALVGNGVVVEVVGVSVVGGGGGGVAVEAASSSDALTDYFFVSFDIVETLL